MKVKKLTIALAQIRSILYDKETNLHRVLEVMSIARDKTANYVLFPELFLTGFYLGERVADLAETINGNMISKIRKHAKSLGVGVIVGFPELDGDRIYNSAAFIDKNGDILGTYRKIHLFDHEKMYFTRGENVPVFNIPEGKIGIMITYDMEFPEVARILAVKGAQAIFILCANMIPYQVYQDIYLKARAIENHVFVAAANLVGLENDYVYFGESKIIHPTGKSLFEALNNEEIAIVSVDLAETFQSKGVLDYITNRRPDLYKKEGL